MVTKNKPPTDRLALDEFVRDEERDQKKKLETMIDRRRGKSGGRLERWRAVSSEGRRIEQGRHEPVVSDAFSNLGQFYTFQEEIGRGASGVVKRCLEKATGEFRACKTILKSTLRSPVDVHDLKAEISTLLKLQGHPCVVKLHGVFEDAACVHLVMDYCSGGDLFSKIKERGAYSEHDAAIVCRKLALALAFAHKNGIMHRDIKPENILMASPASHTKVLLADFGAACTFREGHKLNQLIGSPLYISPTVLSHSYGTEADLWSMGVVLYILLCGCPPFWGRTNPDTFRSILEDPLQFNHERFQVVSMEAKNLLSLLLNKDPKSGYMTARDMLEHPWLVKHSYLSPSRTPLLFASCKKPSRMSFEAFLEEESRERTQQGRPKQEGRSRRRSYSLSGNCVEDVLMEAMVDRDFSGAEAKSSRKGVLERAVTPLFAGSRMDMIENGSIGDMVGSMSSEDDDSCIPIAEAIDMSGVFDMQFPRRFK